MQDFEKLGVFYLGKIYNPVKKKTTDDLLLYDSKDLTTHAVCLGMTGSGKTGLGIALLEEAAIDKIPAIIIDPKGDLGDLLLTFPRLSPQDFEPWVDEGEAERKGMDKSTYAQFVAKTWKDGLAEWDEDSQRIQKLKDSVEMVIYTPASRAGIPLSILSSFAAPSKELVLDTGAMRERILSTTSSLLGLLGITADPIKSREHILISTIIDQAWAKGQDLDIATLIQQVQKPPFDKIGALDVDTFYPQKDRMALSISLNNLLASPGFQAWMEGDPLDIQRLFYTKEGKPKLSIITIAHLSDTERMFFVTLLLNQLLGWMRTQPGTSSLRAILYMDEIFGYFPPTSMPPSKIPMLTLLKQARAFGLGVVLATQNPVDLDYKGLSNCGTWFIGRLQTERDKARVIEGLNIASNGEIDSKTLDKMISALGKRIFIMRSIHEKDPILFETRWTMSYLKGPLTLSQISMLTEKTSKPPEEKPSVVKSETSVAKAKPLIPPGVPEFFIRRPTTKPPAHYKPLVAGLAKLHFIDSKNKIDVWKDVCILADPSDDGNSVQWEQGENCPEVKNQMEKEPLPNSIFDELPAGLMKEKNYSGFEKSFAAALYQLQTLSIYSYPDLGLTSKQDESESDFRSRVALVNRENRDEDVKKLRDKYGQKLATLTERARKVQDKINEKKEKSLLSKFETFISFIATILGAFFGRKVTKGSINQAGTSMRRLGKMTKDGQDITYAEEDYKALQQEIEETHAQLDKEIAQITMVTDPSTLKIETMTIRPRKTDISIDTVALAWWPMA